VSLIFASVEKQAELCGFSEYFGFASSPPKKYRTATLSGTNRLKSESGCQNSSSQSSQIDLIFTFSGAATYDASDCSLSSNSRRFDYEYTIQDPPVTRAGGSALSGSLPTESFFGFTLSSCTGTDTRGLTTESGTVKFASGTACCKTGGRRGRVTLGCTQTLSVEDTEADALNRATEVEGTSNISILEDRTTGFSFTKRTVNYAILLRDLVVGLDYEGEVPVDSGVAEVRSSVTYTADTPDTFSFTATKKFHIEGGTLNASISDQDFIDNNYSLNPTVYGLAADADVITPTTALTHSQGMAYRLGIPYVEKSA
jgi:hypothetical protein